ncbi:hypothetical protein GGS23DRAFT_157652 [Durotheca rogersii]|uniref:uncharacterized protein n=1 Tax=Durotheca rogersii TaxID=419775 RepID=UPI00221F3070|nr:uncharacterized protein GGS23DRAFT_157652 [Durotheca rogersii]KAI5861195.1 hypothetical protein GGS23DRAFT_157652 [Durotheca rogersii]
MAFLADIRRSHRRNVENLRKSPLAEISGALGDLGTLLPLMITLAINGSISLSTTLVFSGFFNIATGVIFGIPLPVQPMKAIAAAAIASKASQRETVAAGSIVGAVVLFLSVTGLLRWAARVIPVPVVKGIQLGAGLSLIISAGTSLLMLPPSRWACPPLDGPAWAAVAFVLLVLTQRMRRFPYALVVFGVGIAFAFVGIAIGPEPSLNPHHHRKLPRWSTWEPRFAVPRWTAEAIGMGVAQLPLTTLNSVIAVGALAADLRGPSELAPPGVGALGLSVAVMNLAGCWFGAMPVCHGAGGLAAQWRFGARSGASVVLLGAFKMAVGLAFGESLLDLLAAFPKALLGVMVVAAGLELAKVGRSLNYGAPDLWEESVEQRGDGATVRKQHRKVSDEEREERWTVMLTTAAGILACRNDAVGFSAGLLCHWAYRLADWVERRRRGRGQNERTPLLGA